MQPKSLRKTGTILVGIAATLGLTFLSAQWFLRQFVFGYSLNLDIYLRSGGATREIFFGAPFAASFFFGIAAPFFFKKDWVRVGLFTFAPALALGLIYLAPFGAAGFVDLVLWQTLLFGAVGLFSGYLLVILKHFSTDQWKDSGGRGSWLKRFSWDFVIGFLVVGILFFMGFYVYDFVYKLISNISWLNAGYAMMGMDYVVGLAVAILYISTRPYVRFHRRNNQDVTLTLVAFSLGALTVFVLFWLALVAAFSTAQIMIL